MKTIRPQPRSRIPPTTSSASFCEDLKVVSKPSFQASSPSPAASPGGGPPLLATRISTGPSAASASEMNCPGPSSLLRSTQIPARAGSEPFASITRARISSSVASTRSRLREQIATRAPSRASPSATAFPRPLEEAATAATLSFRPRSILAFHLPSLAAKSRAAVTRREAAPCLCPCPCPCPSRAPGAEQEPRPPRRRPHPPPALRHLH